MEDEFIRGNKYYVLYKDEATAYRFLYPITSTDQLLSTLKAVHR